MSLDIQKITGKDPNEKWMNIGLVGFVASIASLLGIHGGGIEVGTNSGEYAPPVRYGGFHRLDGLRYSIEENQGYGRCSAGDGAKKHDSAI